MRIRCADVMVSVFFAKLHFFCKSSCNEAEAWAGARESASGPSPGRKGKITFNNKFQDAELYGKFGSRGLHCSRS